MRRPPPTAPPVRLGIGDGTVEEGAIAVTRMELETAHQGERGVYGKVFIVGQPIGRVGKRRTLAPALKRISSLSNFVRPLLSLLRPDDVAGYNPPWRMDFRG